jgi:hypothetical protein
MDAALRSAVRRRARWRCEYCQLPEAHAPATPFQIEHIVARQHRGLTVLANLALACHGGKYKGTNLTGFDPKTNRLTPLFHPRRHKWQRHFRWNGPALVGRTAIGRTTIAVLGINVPDRVDLREELIEEGVFPPPGS